MKQHLRIIASIILVLTFSSTHAKKYTFIGSGGYYDDLNWANYEKPPEWTSDTIIINGNCYNEETLYFNPGAVLIIKTGKTFTNGNDNYGVGDIYALGAKIHVETGATFNCWALIDEVASLVINGTFRSRSIGSCNSVTITGTFEFAGFYFSNTAMTINNGGLFRISPGGYYGIGSGGLMINAGGTLDNDGIIKGNGSITTSNFINSSTLSPGNSPGSIPIIGNYSPTNTSTHIIEVGGTGSASYDKISVTGTAALNGTLNVTLINGFVPSTNHDIPILTAASITGTFSSATIPAAYTLVYTPTAVLLRSITTTLPVKFETVDAQKEENSIRVLWKVSEELNVATYEVEKSQNGSSFSKIGSVAATGQTNYTFKDNRINPKNFYRIKSIDQDGSFMYSRIVNYNQGKSSIVLRAYPNPVVNTVIVEHSTAKETDRISIMSADGKLVKSVLPASESQQTSIDLTNLKPGTYILRFNSKNGTEIVKLTKQ